MGDKEMGDVGLGAVEEAVGVFLGGGVVIVVDVVVVVHEGDEVRLFEDEPSMVFYETPGHNPGCLTMVMGDLIFTGDAYIPGVKVNTQLPHADKVLARQSLERILRLAEGKRILSGHKV